MQMVEVQVRLTPDDLIRAVEQLDATELERFLSSVVRVRARRHSPGAGAEEARLLERINECLPPDQQARYDALAGKRRAQALTPEEHRELIELSDRVEGVHAQRLMALAELAHLRGVSPDALMSEFGIPAHRHA